MMERSKFSEERQKSHFETGVKMGVGTFNLVSWQLFTGKCPHNACLSLVKIPFGIMVHELHNCRSGRYTVNYLLYCNWSIKQWHLQKWCFCQTISNCFNIWMKVRQWLISTSRNCLQNLAIFMVSWWYVRLTVPVIGFRQTCQRYVMSWWIYGND